MADRYLSFTGTAPGRFITRRVGLPQPAELRRWLDQFDKRFVGLTGTDAALAAVQKAAGVPVAARQGPNNANYSVMHANFVVAVLSDLFGIQARSGCFCAGPYLHRLYAIPEMWSMRMQSEVVKGNLGAKLAFTRITFNYTNAQNTGGGNMRIGLGPVTFCS